MLEYLYDYYNSKFDIDWLHIASWYRQNHMQKWFFDNNAWLMNRIDKVKDHKGSCGTLFDIDVDNSKFSLVHFDK